MDDTTSRGSLEATLRHALRGRALPDIEIAALIDLVLHEVVLFPNGVAVGTTDGVELSREAAADVVAHALGPPASPTRALMLYNQKPFVREAYGEAAQRVRAYLAAAGAYFSTARGLTRQALQDKRSADVWTGRFPPDDKGGSRE